MQKNGNKKSTLARDAEIMELFYSGDKIKIAKLARQLNMDKSFVRIILAKYYPAKSNRDVAMLISSKINVMYGEGDYQLKQENPED